MTFDWGELVAVSSGAPSDYRPGNRGWVVGMPANDESVGSGLLPSASSVYLVEFEDGFSMQVPATLLRRLRTSP